MQENLLWFLLIGVVTGWLVGQSIRGGASVLSATWSLGFWEPSSGVSVRCIRPDSLWSWRYTGHVGLGSCRAVVPGRPHQEHVGNDRMARRPAACQRQGRLGAAADAFDLRRSCVRLGRD